MLEQMPRAAVKSLSSDSIKTQWMRPQPTCLNSEFGPALSRRLAWRLPGVPSD